MIDRTTFYRVGCDVCDFISPKFYVPATIQRYLAGDPPKDGVWLTTSARHICRGCIIDRACRIFGHQIVRQPDVLGGRTACTRCQTFQAVSS